MSPLDTSLVWELARTTLWLALAAVSAALVLKLARVQSPALHRTAWCATLVVGCLVVRMPVEVPWYPAERAAAPPIEPERQSTIVPLREEEIASGPPIETPPLDFDAELVAASEELSPSALQTVPPAAPSAEPPARWRPSWQQGAITAWALGMIAIAAAWVVGYSWFVWRLPSALVSPADWQGQWNALLAGQGVRRRIPLRVTLNLGPLLCRLPRGYELLVPEPLWRRLNAAEREAILRHELAHWRRGDVWKSLAARVLALPHWFNPVSWWAVRRFDEAAEWACDRAATDDEPTAYARILVHLSELAGPRARYGSALRGRPLAARIRRLVTLEQKEDTLMKKSFVIAAAACLVSAALVRVQLIAQEPVAPDDVQTAPTTPVAQSVEDVFDPTPKADDSATAPAPVARHPDAEPDRAAEQKTVDAAKAAYDAALAAYQAENTSLESVYVWSSRWSAAALSAARKPEERIAAANQHLDRMRDLQQKIKALFDGGARGGEALEMASANFYVAEAERKLAEFNSPPNVAPRVSSVPRAVAPHAYKTPQPAPPSAAPPAIQPRLPFSFFVGPQAAAPAQPPAANPYSTPQPASSRGAKDILRYDQKTLDQWITLLRTDLSPALRKDAMHALAEFAANGYGRVATETVFDTMQAYSVWSIESTPEGELKLAALYAARKAPLEDMLPVAAKALKSGNSNQRLFALRVLPLDKAKDEIVPLLVSAMQDKDPEVADLALWWLAAVDHDAPALADWLRAALLGKNPQDQSKALGLLGAPRINISGLSAIPIAPFPAFAPEIVALLGHDKPGIRRQAANCLRKLGQAAVPALEQEASKSATALTSTRARQILNQIQKTELGLRTAGPAQEFDWERE